MSFQQQSYIKNMNYALCIMNYFVFLQHENETYSNIW